MNVVNKTAIDSIISFSEFFFLGNIDISNQYTFVNYTKLLGNLVIEVVIILKQRM